MSIAQLIEAGIPLLHRALREPLLHFLLLGGLLFGVYAVLPGEPEADQQIVVDHGRLAALQGNFVKAWRRPPTGEELDGLVRDYVREEMAVREARALDIDQDDSVIRRLLRQRLEFVTADLVRQAEPSEEQLQDYWKRHPEAFLQPSRYSFSQVFVDPSRHGANLQAEAARLLSRLNGGDSRDALEVDRSALEPIYADLSVEDLDRLFGSGFGHALSELPQDRWAGPLQSAYGAHLVRLERVQLAAQAEFAAVREPLRQAWQRDQRQQQLDQFYVALQERYQVVIVADAQP
ncbi:peptidyl-prolyl cis-trans isomerase [Pseudomonas paeninsulae]|uniref:peptidyl-prolyl cis-trans isomerase n=1 Tax=Pseudomonas paeninsulae TaxID=3110772 RepID=UPI002D783703|nr:peptidyl-prolyl cis-trans isomerase [Pseudomonas sp. IT1137]